MVLWLVACAETELWQTKRAARPPTTRDELLQMNDSDKKAV